MTTPGKDAVGARAPESVSFPAAAPAPKPVPLLDINRQNHPIKGEINAAMDAVVPRA